MGKQGRQDSSITGQCQLLRRTERQEGALGCSGGVLNPKMPSSELLKLCLCFPHSLASRIYFSFVLLWPFTLHRLWSSFPRLQGDEYLLTAKQKTKQKYKGKVCQCQDPGAYFEKQVLFVTCLQEKKHSLCFRQLTLNFWDEIYPNCWFCPSFCRYQVIKNIAHICINQRQEITGKSQAVQMLPTVTTQIFFPSGYVPHSLGEMRLEKHTWMYR